MKDGRSIKQLKNSNFVRSFVPSVSAMRRKKCDDLRAARGSSPGRATRDAEI